MLNYHLFLGHNWNQEHYYGSFESIDAILEDKDIQEASIECGTIFKTLPNGSLGEAGFWDSKVDEWKIYDKETIEHG